MGSKLKDSLLAISALLSIIGVALLADHILDAIGVGRWTYLVLMLVIGIVWSVIIIVLIELFNIFESKKEENP